MNLDVRKALSMPLMQAALASALILSPLAVSAQSFFVGGGTTNNAFNTSNIGLGFQSLSQNSTGSNNTALGYQTLSLNTGGSSNTAVGSFVLTSNTSGNYNSALGYGSLYANTNGNNNTAAGYQALNRNTTGNDNSAFGYLALYTNMAGLQNVAIGNNALFSNTMGNYNAASGFASLAFNTTGSYNTASGDYALYSGTTGNNNIGLGFGAGQNITTGNNNIAIGNPGTNGDNGVIRIGSSGVQSTAFLAGVNGTTISNGVQVFIDANGQLGTVTSSRRFKQDITDMGGVSDKLMQLRPVTFRYKQAASDGTHPLQYGLIAEDVAKVFPDLVQVDKQGKPFTIYYHLLTPMLLNELQKEHKQQETQKAEVATLKTAHKAEIAALKSELAALKQSQQEQLAAINKLTNLVVATQNKPTAQKAVYIAH